MHHLNSSLRIHLLQLCVNIAAYDVALCVLLDILADVGEALYRLSLAHGCVLDEEPRELVLGTVFGVDSLVDLLLDHLHWQSSVHDLIEDHDEGLLSDQVEQLDRIVVPEVIEFVSC